jgi:hypothetical protein
VSVLNTGDLVSQLDILALEAEILKTLGDYAENFSNSKRRVAVEHWLSTRVRQAGYIPMRHQTRRTPDKFYGFTSGVYTDLLTAADTKGDPNIEFAAAIGSSTADYLLVGFKEPYRGLWVGLLDSVNINTLSANSITYWDGGAWSRFSSLTDATYAANSIAMSGGGRIMWQVPDDWAPRPVGEDGSSDWYYWARIQMSRVPSTSTIARQLLPIRRSRLTVPGAMHAIGLLCREAAAITRGEWAEKAKMYLDGASAELTAVLPFIADEFDVDDTGSVGRVEVSSVTPAGGFQWERG